MITPTPSASAMNMIAALLEQRTGQQIAANRAWRIETALKPVLRLRGLETLDDLVAQLMMSRTGELGDMVADALLNQETSFFRDSAVLDMVADAAQVLQAEAGTRRLRIWSAGCSTGQEVFSLAMLFAEAPEQWLGWTIDILGTDVSTQCIDRARTGTYTQFEVQRGLGINQMIKWFEECPDGWRAVEALRKPLRYQVHNLLEPPPHPGDFDIVLCRNVLLYLSPDKKALAFERLASAMAEDGWLMLGAGETVIGQTSRLGADIKARGLYRLTGDGSRVEKRSGERRAATGG